jgi:hypothetical protein
MAIWPSSAGRMNLRARDTEVLLWLARRSAGTPDVSANPAQGRVARWHIRLRRPLVFAYTRAPPAPCHQRHDGEPRVRQPQRCRSGENAKNSTKFRRQHNDTLLPHARTRPRITPFSSIPPRVHISVVIHSRSFRDPLGLAVRVSLGSHDAPDAVDGPSLCIEALFEETNRLAVPSRSRTERRLLLRTASSRG